MGEIRRTVAGSRLHIDHQHEEIEFDLVLRGAGSYSIGNTTYELKPGTLLWLANGQQHRLIRSPKLQMWVVSIRPGQLTDKELSEIRAQPSRVIPGQELVDLDGLLGQVAQDSDEVGTYNAGIAYAVRRALRATRDCPPADVKLMHPAVTRALMLLRQSGADFSLSGLAEESGIAPTYLSRLLVEHTNRSFVDWRNRIRLERFVEDYRPGANLLQAALDAGFGSYARFHHVFSDMVGCTPSEWAHGGEGQLPPGLEQPDGSAAPGLPSLPHLSVRQRWTRVVPLVSPIIEEFFGENFIERLLSAPKPEGAHRADGQPALPSALSSQQVELLIETLRTKHAERADELGRLIFSHDFAGLFSGVLRLYEMTPTALPDIATAFVVAIWTASHMAPDPSFEQVAGVHRQVAALLSGRQPLPAEQAVALHAAIMVEFVVIYHSVQAARAGSDGRALAQLRPIMAELGRGLFGPAIEEAELTAEGLRRKQPARA